MVCLILPTYSVYLCPGVGLDIFLGDRNVFCLTTCFSSQLPSYQSLNSSVIWDDKMNTNMNTDLHTCPEGELESKDRCSLSKMAHIEILSQSCPVLIPLSGNFEKLLRSRGIIYIKMTKCNFTHKSLTDDTFCRCTVPRGHVPSFKVTILHDVF